MLWNKAQQPVILLRQVFVLLKIGNGVAMPKHEIRKVRLEAIWRTLTVTSKQLLTPQMLRVNFLSNELDTFESPSHDDHVKLLLQSGSSTTETVMRDFTPRAWNSAAGTFVLEFALHAAGPAVDWARSAKAGDTLQIGGPRGSVSVPDDFDWYLLVGDATALPAIARRVESLRPGVPVNVIALIAGKAEVQPFNPACEFKVTWLISNGDAERDLSLVRSSLAQYVLPSGDGFIWAAGEALFTKAVHAWAIEERGHPAEWVKAAAYWRRK